MDAGMYSRNVELIGWPLSDNISSNNADPKDMIMDPSFCMWH
jgi:hypothetical protein